MSDPCKRFNARFPSTCTNVFCVRTGICLYDPEKINAGLSPRRSPYVYLQDRDCQTLFDRIADAYIDFEIVGYAVGPQLHHVILKRPKGND